MCKGSVAAKKTVEAKAGDSLAIGTSAHGLPAFHGLETTASACVTCVRNDTVLTLRSLPLDLQQAYNIGAMAVVTFVETGDDVPDQVRLANGRFVDLAKFANRGVQAYVGMLETVQQVDITTENDAGDTSVVGKRARVLVGIALVMLLLCASTPLLA